MARTAALSSTRSPMRITDTLDQLLRSLVTVSSAAPVDDGADAQRPGAPPPLAAPDDHSAPLAIDLEEAASEGAIKRAVAIKRAYELDRPDPIGLGVTPVGTTPPLLAERGLGDLAQLEASAGAVENLGVGFHLGAAIERIATAAGQGSEGRLRLREAAWLIDRYIALLEERPGGAHPDA